MQNNKKVAVIGATGKAGKYLLRQLLEQSYRVKILLRDPSSFHIMHPLLEVVQGDARVYDSVHRLVHGRDAIVSTLGQPRGESAIFSTATQNVLRAMKAESINRYIVITELKRRHARRPEKWAG